MTSRMRLIALFLIFTAAIICTASYMVSATDSSQTKIAPWVMQNTAEGRAAEFLVILTEQADLHPAHRFSTKQQRGKYVRDSLWAKAQSTQAPILDWLRTNNIEHRPFYIINAILVKGTRQIAETLAARPDVARIEGNPAIRNLPPVSPSIEEINNALRQAASPTAIEPGVTYIRAPEVWATGFTGQGIVIGGADTGVKWDHSALKNKYRGWDGATANHDYNWHDSIHTGGGSCGSNSPFPCDDDNHGTHTVGTALGDDGSSNQIGVAPGAKFIGCRNMDQGNGTPATYIECMEWFLAPYPVSGTSAQGDPAKAPDITTNSWGCPPSEGCSPASLQQAVEAQRAAGIMMVVAAGNSGSGCSTVSDPPSFYDASYTIGAISSSTGNIASFSSRGPVTADGSGRIKPDVSAPGVSVRSAVRSGGYSSFSGTSMATPHVAGAIALLWSARPTLRNQIEATKNVTNQAAVDVFTTSCNSNGIPNNVYGWGRLDIKAAVDSVAASITPTSQNIPASGGGGTVNVTAPAGFNWTAVSNALWITVTSGANGSGNGTVTYTVNANTGSARAGTITIAGQTFTVNQSGETPAGLQYYPLPFPVRLLDTRPGETACDTPGVPITGGLPRTEQARLTCSNITIPSAAAAIVGNATVVNNQPGAGSGFITLYPSGAALPVVSNINYIAGQIVPNGFTVALGATGSFEIFASSTTHMIIDVTGYYAPPATGGLYYHPLPRPARLLDTRNGETACDAPGAVLAGGIARPLQARVTCAGVTIPANAQAIVGNATVVNFISPGGFVTLYPTGVARPNASNLNFTAGQIIPNAFTVALGPNGEFEIYPSNSTDFIIDVAGYFSADATDVNGAGLLFYPLQRPVRLLDSRPGQPACNTPGVPLTGGQSQTILARVTCDGVTIPANAASVLGNATAINFFSPSGFVTIYPSGTTRPIASNLNYLTNQIIANAFVTGLGNDGGFNIYTSTTINFLVDLTGYFAP